MLTEGGDAEIVVKNLRRQEAKRAFIHVKCISAVTSLFYRKRSKTATSNSRDYNIYTVTFSTESTGSKPKSISAEYLKTAM